MPSKKRLSHPRKATSLNFLTPAERTKISSDGRKLQTFRNLVVKLAGNVPVPERRLRLLSRVAANRVLGKEKALEPRSKKRFSAAGIPQRIIDTFMCDQNVLFAAGGRSRIEMVPGPPIAEFKEEGPAIRIMIKPKIKDNEYKNAASIRRELSSIGYLDIHETLHPELLGSIGYLGGNFQRIQGFEKPIFITWLREDRILPYQPREFQKSFHRWDFEGLRVIENQSKRAGLKVVAVISPEHMRAKLEGRKDIEKIYEDFSRGLERRGYQLKLLTPKGQGQTRSPYKIPFLVKYL